MTYALKRFLSVTSASVLFCAQAFASPGSPLQKIDPSNPIEVKKSFFKNDYLQSDKKVDMSDFEEHMIKGSPPQKMYGNAQFFHDAGIALLILSPFLIIYGATTNSANWQSGQNFMISGAVTLGGGWLLLNHANNQMAQSVEDWNQSLKKP